MPISNTLEKASNLELATNEMTTHNPVQNIIQAHFAVAGYNGLLSTLLNQILKNKNSRIKNKINYCPLKSNFQKRFQMSKNLQKEMQNKKFCPMLNDYEKLFLDQPGNLENFDSNGLDQRNEFPIREIMDEKETMMDNAESMNLGEQSEIECVLTGEIQSTKKQTYKVENFDEARTLEKEILNSTNLPSEHCLFQHSQIESDLNLISLKSQQATKSRSTQGSFDYWARLEPEKWKYKSKFKRQKSKRVGKSMSTRSSRGRKRITRKEKFQLDKKRVFSEGPNSLSSSEVIDMMKAKKYKIQSRRLDFGNLRTIIPLSPNLPNRQFYTIRGFCGHLGSIEIKEDKSPCIIEIDDDDEAANENDDFLDKMADLKEEIQIVTFQEKQTLQYERKNSTTIFNTDFSQVGDPR